MARIEPLPGLIVATLRALGVTGQPPLVLAVSGGRDSRVLLHAATRVWPAEALIVAHVQHGLQPAAEDWLVFCRDLADAAGLRFEARRLTPRDGPGVESWARQQRYLALADIARAAGAGLVLTAHHANDQLETAQMRRLRGAGPLGLAGMRVVAPVPGAPDLRLVRPFLTAARATLAGYAGEHDLDWVEDPSNRDPRFLRNRVRARLDEAIERDETTLWRGLATIDEMQREADRRRAMAERDLQSARLQLFNAPTEVGAGGLSLGERGGSAGAPAAVQDSLSRAVLARLPPARAAEALRAWLAGLGCRMPSRARLGEISRQLLEATGSEGRVWHDGRWLLRYRDRIDSLAELPAPLAPVAFRWDGETELVVAGVRFSFRVLEPGRLLDPSLASVGAAVTGGPGLDMGLAEQRLRTGTLLLDHGQRNDRIRVAPGGRSRSWRNLLQERGIPTWLRRALPVIRDDQARLLFAAPFGCNHPGPQAAGADSPEAPCDTGRQVVVSWLAPAHLRHWL